MKRPSKFFLAILLLTVASVGWAACPEGTKNNYKGECVPVDGSSMYISLPDDIASGFKSGWEWIDLSVRKPYSLQVVDEGEGHPVRAGSQSLRFEVRGRECGVGEKTSDCGPLDKYGSSGDRRRVQISNFDEDQRHGNERWYAWSLFFPEDWISLYPTTTNIVEWHYINTKEQIASGEDQKYCCDYMFFSEKHHRAELVDETKYQPNNLRNTRSGQPGYWLSNERYGLTPTSLTGDPMIGHTKRLTPANQLLGCWHDYLVHFNMRYDDKGFFKMYADNELAYEYYGPTTWGKKLNHFMIGIYNTYLSRYSKTGDIPTQYFYMDEIRKGKTRVSVTEHLPSRSGACMPMSPVVSSAPARAKESADAELTTSSDISVQISKVEREGTTSDGSIWREIDVVLPNHGSVYFEPHVWFWGGATEDKPNHVGLKFNHKTLPSIDIPKMKKCGGYKWFAKETSMGNKRVMFPFREKRNVAPCLYNALDESDQAIVKAVIEQIEDIIGQGVKGEPDADYWKSIAKVIKDNGANVIQ